MTYQQDYLNMWHTVISSCAMGNTYKMAWGRAIVETCYQRELNPEESGLIEIPLKDIAEKFFSYYWNQTFFFDPDYKHLRQGPNPNKPPKIVKIVENEIEKFKEAHSHKPVSYLLACKKLSINFMQVVSLLKQDVSYRFLKLGTEDVDLYDYKIGADSIFITPDKVKSLKANRKIIVDLINFRWTKKLEELNRNVPNIGLKVSFISEKLTPRKSLKRFVPILLLENPARICSICGNPIGDDDISVDHVIPWSFMYSDDIWNLMLAHSGCNSRKSNKLVTEEEHLKLKQRNINLLNLMKLNGHNEYIRNKDILELAYAVEHDLISKFRMQFNC